MTVSRRRTAPPERPRSLLAATTAAAAVAGVAFGLLLTTGESRSPAPARDRSVPVATSGAARLPLPEGWRTVRRPPAIPGLEAATALRAGSSNIALDFRAPEHYSLLPAATVRAFGAALAAPTLQRVGQRQAFAYQLPGSTGERRIAALALPTDRGVVTLACRGRANAFIAPQGDCDEALLALELVGARSLAAVKESAAAIALTGAIARLDELRGAGRQALAAARWPRARAAAARSLAAAYARAAARLEPLAAGAALPLAADLDGLARDYRTLAAASLRRVAPAARRAGRSIGRRERRLPARLAAVHQAAPRTAG